jgi:hypothetical protein
MRAQEFIRPQLREDIENFPIANVRRPNGAIGNQGVNTEQAADVLTHAAGMQVTPDMTMRQLVDALKADPAAQQRLRQFVQKNPITVYALPDGSYHLQDGNHRTFLLNLLGDETVPAVVKENVAEARRNPDQNKKYGMGKYELAAFAEDIRDQENWAVSMTAEPKLGINPQVGISEDTPKGIYFYPLEYFLQMVNRYQPLPWGDNMPYMQLFQYDRSGEMTQQTQVDPDRLRQALSQYCPDDVIQQVFNEPDQLYDGTSYWMIYDALSRLGTNDETNIVRWNKVLRDLGFTSVYDPGAGWIAYNEPTQGVVLDPRIIRQHKMFVNRNPKVKARQYDIQGLADAIMYNGDYDRERQRQRITYGDPAEVKARLDVAKSMLRPFLGKTEKQAKEMGLDQAIKTAGEKVIEILRNANKSVTEAALGNVLSWPEVVNKINSAMKATGWNGKREDENTFLFTAKGQETDDQWYIMLIANQGNGMFSYALGTVEDGDPYLDDAFKDVLPTTDASVSELLNIIRDAFGLHEQGVAEGSEKHLMRESTSEREIAKIQYMQGECAVLALTIRNMNPQRFTLGFVYEFFDSLPDRYLEPDEFDELDPARQRDIKYNHENWTLTHAYVYDALTREYIDAEGRHKQLPMIGRDFNSTRYNKFPAETQDLVNVSHYMEWDKAQEKWIVLQGWDALDKSYTPEDKQRAREYAIKYLGIDRPAQDVAENFADGKNPGRKELDPDVYEDLDNGIIARVARQIVPTIRAKSTPEGYVYLKTADGLSLVIGCSIADGSIGINIGTGHETTSSGPHKGAITEIVQAVYQAAVKHYGTPNQPGSLSVDHDAGHGVWQHIAQKLGLEYAAHMVKENFHDGKNPQDKGDSARHGIPKHATMAELEKASHAKGRKGQLARWQLNMRRGHKK